MLNCRKLLKYLIICSGVVIVIVLVVVLVVSLRDNTEIENTVQNSSNGTLERFGHICTPTWAESGMTFKFDIFYGFVLLNFITTRGSEFIMKHNENSFL